MIGATALAPHQIKFAIELSCVPDLTFGLGCRNMQHIAVMHEDRAITSSSNIARSKAKDLVGWDLEYADALKAEIHRFDRTG